MNLESQRILVTGAGGGIGQELCTLLAARKARLCLLDKTHENAERMACELKSSPSEILTVEADITRAEDRERAINKMTQAWGGIDILINLAGIMDFVRFDEQDPGMIHRLIQINVEAPMQMIRSVLPQMMERSHGRIVNMGSMFALRGFSQALRRELAGSGVGVTYVSPRAVRTPFNPPVVHHMARLGLMHMDDPHWVAKKILLAIEKDKEEAYIGFPESLFARLNAIVPGIVSHAITRQVPALVSFTRDNAKA
jgi:short-subunit dehydrogenase